MLIVSTDDVPGRTIREVHGLVSGAVITTKHIGKDIGAGLKSLVGGELRSYTRMMEDARSEATDRLIETATAKGANAIVGTRFSAGQVAAGAAEIYVYGTAVTLD